MTRTVLDPESKLDDLAASLLFFVIAVAIFIVIVFVVFAVSFYYSELATQIG